MDKRSGVIIAIVVTLIVLSLIITSCLTTFQGISLTEFGIAKVGIIEMNGQIMGEAPISFFPTAALTPEYVKEQIKLAEKANVDAIIFKINSPGGTVLATKKIGDAIKKLNVTTIAVIDEVGASGGYWAASAADIVIADEMSIVGSIGVLSQSLEFSGLMEKYGVRDQTITGGEYKDIGSPFREMTEEERAILQSKIDTIHQYFINEIASNRGMSQEEVEKVATGLFYLGGEAKALGLVDEIGGMDLAREIIKKQFNVTELQEIQFQETPGLLDLLTGMLSKPAYYLGKGVGSSIFKTEENNLQLKV